MCLKGFVLGLCQGSSKEFLSHIVEYGGAGCPVVQLLLHSISTLLYPGQSFSALLWDAPIQTVGSAATGEYEVLTVGNAVFSPSGSPQLLILTSGPLSGDLVTAAVM